MVTPRMPVRHQYDLESEIAAGEAATTYFDDASLTNQQFTDDVNINIMVRRFGITDGSIPPGAFDPNLFGDFTEAPQDLTEVFQRMRAAEDLFMQLPADIRTKFGNNAAALLSYLNDPANEKEALELGLLHTTQPAPPPVAPPA